ncbi:MAG: gentisate 1,2-dioxygenase [Pseudomonadota bacterium]
MSAPDNVSADVSSLENREAYYRRIGAHHLTPLWEVMSSLITPTPSSACVAHRWHYDGIRDHLLEAGRLITAREAERRVLVLENPGLAGTSQITTSLYGGLQLVLPGEVAPAHRHSQSALRFVIEGSGAHTAVDGERTKMEIGDFVITPPGAWHDHGNLSDAPMVWLDGLDLPIASLFDASFAEGYPSEEQPVVRPVGDSLARYGANMLPLGYEDKRSVSPIFNYPFERSREALESMRRLDEWDPCHGLKMRYVNPHDGGFAMPTIATFLQLLPKSFTTAGYRSTDATVFVCVEGLGETEVDGETFQWGPRDIWVIPSWKTVIHRASDDSVLFSFSDRAAQTKLGFFREERIGENTP